MRKSTTFDHSSNAKKNLEIWPLTALVSKTALIKLANFTKQKWKLVEALERSSAHRFHIEQIELV